MQPTPAVRRRAEMVGSSVTSSPNAHDPTPVDYSSSDGARSMSELKSFDIRSTPDGVRELGVFLPRPTPASFMAFIAHHACQLPELSTRSVHLYGIADTGIPLASAILMHRHMKHLAGYEDDYLTIVSPRNFEYLPTVFDDSAIHIIVDNSVKSLRTLSEVSYRLRASSVTNSILLKLVDYEDPIEESQRSIIEKDYGLRVVSVFDLSDIVASQPLTPTRRGERTLTSRS